MSAELAFTVSAQRRQERERLAALKTLAALIDRRATKRERPEAVAALRVLGDAVGEYVTLM